jgi:hypothetical protein
MKNLNLVPFRTHLPELSRRSLGPTIVNTPCGRENELIQRLEAVIDPVVAWVANHGNMTNEPNGGQVVGNAEAVLEIQVKSEMTGEEALDNVAGFGGNEPNTIQG